MCELANSKNLMVRFITFVQANKRKRNHQSNEDSLDTSMKSMSQLSISQQTSKKIKYSTSKTMSSYSSNDNELGHDQYTFYKSSKYLKMPRKLLLHSLRLHLHCPLKKKKEQKFILTRLTIVDQQFCLQQLQYLYRTYYEQGAQYQVWLVSITYSSMYIDETFFMIYKG